MGTLDPILVDVATEVGISTSKTASLLSTLLSSITETPKGLAGFLERFRNAGYSEVVASWLGGTPRSLSDAELETTMGRDWIEKAAAKASLPSFTATSALAFMLPRVIQRLTPGGIASSRIPSDVLPYIQCAGSPPQTRSGGAQRVVPKRNAKPTAAPPWLWPVLLVLAILLLGSWYWSHRHSAKDTRIERRQPAAVATRWGLGSPFARPA